MSEHAPWCWICQKHHEPVNLSARIGDSWRGLLDELLRMTRNSPASRRRAAMRTAYRRRTRTRTRSRR